MDRWVEVVNSTRGRRLARARWCVTFACRLRGLSLRRRLEQGEGLVLVEARPSRIGAAIHMAGMLFPLGIVWIDGDGRVVDTRLAQPWGIYLPSAPAQFTLEASSSILDEIGKGDQVVFRDEKSR
jgi:uncharacterized membrane protein (UPF0127 family)